MNKLRKQVRNICPEKAGVLANFSRRTQVYCELWSWQHWRVILFKEKRKNMKPEYEVHCVLNQFLISAEEETGKQEKAVGFCIYEWKIDSAEGRFFFLD